MEPIIIMCLYCFAEQEFKHQDRCLYCQAKIPKRLIVAIVNRMNKNQKKDDSNNGGEVS